MLGDQKEGEKQATPPIEKWKGCTCIIMNMVGPNGRCLKDQMPKSKPMLMGGEGAKKVIK